MAGVSLCFYGGVEGEVGGNQILLQDGETRILLDFGHNYSLWREYFSFPISMPRSLSDYYQVGLLPKELKGEQDRISAGIEACLISHAHTDHWRAISGLESIDAGGPQIHAGETACNIIQKRGEKLRGFESISHHRLSSFRSQKRFSVGAVEVLPFHVDHSIPGAYAFLVHTSQGLIVYTGDLRLHGSYSRKLRSQFWRAIGDEPVEALICEGTNAGELNVPLTEKDVQRLGQRCVKGSKGLVLVNLSPLDVDRLRTFHQVSETCNRRLVATESFMDYLRIMSEEKVLEIPDVEKGEILEYDEEEREELRRDPSGYILLTSFYRWREIQEIEPPSGSIFILSTSEPFEEESEVEFRRLVNWLRLYGVQAVQIHTSGHAFPFDIRRIVSLTRPRRIIPVHTSNCAAFHRLVSDLATDCGTELIEPRRGQRYMLQR